MPKSFCRNKTTDTVVRASSGSLLWGLTATALLCLVCNTPPALGAPGAGGPDGSDPGARDYKIRKIFLEGNRRTNRDVILRELVFETGDTVGRDQIEESIQRLQNVGVFDEVDYELVEVAGTRPKPEYYLLLDLEEQWTIIPVFNGAFGGDLLQLQVGVFDINLLGRFLRGGVKYRRLGDTNSFSVWFEDPRFLGERLMVGTNLYRSARLRVLYDDAGEAEGGYLRERWGAGVSAEREWRWWLRTSAGLGFHADSYSTKYLSDELVELERRRGLPADHAGLTVSGDVTFGRIDRDSYLRDGIVGSLSAQYSPPLLPSGLHFADLSIGGSFYETLPLKANLAVSLSTGMTNAEAVEHRYFLGGLGSLRGFVDSRLRGNRYWLANAEFRIPSLDTEWVVLQHVVFADAGNADLGARTFGRVGGASVGIGFRLISPKIYNFVARVDWAFPVVGHGRSPFSAGSGQFL